MAQFGIRWWAGRAQGAHRWLGFRLRSIARGAVRLRQKIEQNLVASISTDVLGEHSFQVSSQVLPGLLLWHQPQKLQLECCGLELLLAHVGQVGESDLGAAVTHTHTHTRARGVNPEL